MHKVHFGSESEYVKIVVPKTFSSEGWGQATVIISVECFRGEINPWVQAGDFECLSLELRALYETLKGKAEFAPLENQFSLELTALTGGHVELKGYASAHTSHGNKLEFELALDQTYLQRPLARIEEICSHFKPRLDY